MRVTRPHAWLQAYGQVLASNHECEQPSHASYATAKCALHTSVTQFKLRLRGALDRIVTPSVCISRFTVHASRIHGCHGTLVIVGLVCFLACPACTTDEPNSIGE